MILRRVMIAADKLPLTARYVTDAEDFMPLHNRLMEARLQVNRIA